MFYLGRKRKREHSLSLPGLVGPASIKFQLTITTSAPSETFTLPCGNTGTYDAVIRWGDGSSDDITTYNDADLAHVYADAGTYTITITGTLPWIRFNNGGDKVLVDSVVLADKNSISWASGFYGCSNITSITGIEPDSVENFSSFARGCSSLILLDTSNWGTSSVTNFSNFVYGCSSLTTLDVSGLDTSSTVNFAYFCFGCSSLTTLDISGWDTSLVTSFAYFAWNCSSLTSITVSGAFDNSPCTDYTNAFINCALNQTTVDAILVSINTANTSNGTLNISGGTNSAPGAAGAAAVSSLTSRGWVVTTN